MSIYRVLLSGGMDSAVCLAWAKTQAATVEGVFFNYGQQHLERERAAAAEMAELAGVVLRNEALALPASNLNGDASELDAASAVVPGRNRMFLLRAALMRPVASDLVIGACADDAEHFPDCRPLFYEEMRHLMRPVRIHTPLIDKSKSEVVAAARRFADVLNIDALSWVRASWSCYRGGDTPCGNCGACEARALAVACPFCTAEPGVKCYHPNHGFVQTHRERVAASLDLP
jgi:7-cyano-7-deazaguanine synthase